MAEIVNSAGHDCENPSDPSEDTLMIQWWIQRQSTDMTSEDNWKKLNSYMIEKKKHDYRWEDLKARWLEKTDKKLNYYCGVDLPSKEEYGWRDDMDADSKWVILRLRLQKAREHLGIPFEALVDSDEEGRSLLSIGEIPTASRLPEEINNAEDDVSELSHTEIKEKGSTPPLTPGVNVSFSRRRFDPTLSMRGPGEIACDAALQGITGLILFGKETFCPGSLGYPSFDKSERVPAPLVTTDDVYSVRLNCNSTPVVSSSPQRSMDKSGSFDSQHSTATFSGATSNTGGGKVNSVEKVKTVTARNPEELLNSKREKRKVTDQNNQNSAVVEEPIKKKRDDTKSRPRDEGINRENSQTCTQHRIEHFVRFPTRFESNVPGAPSVDVLGYEFPMQTFAGLEFYVFRKCKDPVEASKALGREYLIRFYGGNVLTFAHMATRDTICIGSEDQDYNQEMSTLTQGHIVHSVSLERLAKCGRQCQVGDFVKYSVFPNHAYEGTYQESGVSDNVSHGQADGQSNRQGLEQCR